MATTAGTPVMTSAAASPENGSWAARRGSRAVSQAFRQTRRSDGLLRAV